MKKLFNWKFVLFLVLFIALFLRLYQLGDIPYGTPDDETSYIYNAYSIWHTGKSIEGTALPLSFNAHSSQSPVEVYLTAPIVGIMGISLFYGRLLSALFGFGSVFLLFLITDYLFKNKPIGILSAFLFAVSPWALQLQRGLWDINFSSFFYLLALYIFIVNIKSSKYLWSLIPFLLGFYSYHGTKVYFVFLIPLLIFMYRKELLARKIQLSIFIFVTALIVSSFFLIAKYQNVTRQAEVSLFESKSAAENVNWEREKNTAPWLTRSLFSNKLLYYFRVVREHYLEAFSTNFLFLYGEVGNASQIDNIFFRGVLYIIDLPLLLIGLSQLWKLKNKFNRNFLLALLAISPIPSAITVDTNFVNRDFMLLPILLIIISMGICYLVKGIWKLNKHYKIIALSVFVVCYSFLIADYFYQYYFRWTVYGAETWGASDRDVVKYINDNKNLYSNIYVVNTSNKNFFLQYATFSKTDPAIVQKNWNNKKIKIDNITMMQDCLHNGTGDTRNFLPKNTLFISSEMKCHYSNSPFLKITDRGEVLHTIWNIYTNN